MRRAVEPGKGVFAFIIKDRRAVFQVTKGVSVHDARHPLLEEGAK